MTAQEYKDKSLDKMKHALGMSDKVVDGVFETNSRSLSYPEPDYYLESLIANGFVKRIGRNDGKEFVYVLTENGIQYVANVTGVTIRCTLEFEPKNKK